MFVEGLQAAHNAYDYPLLIKNLLITSRNHYPNKEIVYADHSRYSYKDLNLRIARLGHALNKLGVKANDTFAILDYDSNRYLECFFAIPMLGAVLHTVNIRLSNEQILYTINHAADDFILVHEDFLSIIDSIKDRIEKKYKLIILSDSTTVKANSLDIENEYESLLENSDADFQFNDFSENTRATTFYTTGTTGAPKGVYYSHRQLVLHTLALGASMSMGGNHGRLSSEDVYMPITPMFHVHAWGFPYLATLFGTKQVYPGKYQPDHLLSLITNEKVSISHCVPTILHMLLQSQEKLQTDLSKWKVIIGGAALHKDLAARAMKLGIDIFAGYGLSETCPVLTLAKLDDAMLSEDSQTQLNYRCKAGRPIAMVDIKTHNASSQSSQAVDSSDGEIVVRAPWLTQGYLHESKRSDELWHSGYLHTGDIGVIDDLGFVKITDRLKDVIKTGGEWVSSLDLEDIVGQLDGVNEVAAFGIAHEKWSERPVILVLADQDTDLTEQLIKSHLTKFIDNGTLSKWAMPEKIYFVDHIAKTSVGKIDKKALRLEYR